MTVSLASYRIAPLEKPASAAKQNNMLSALENAFNAFPATQIVGYPADATKFLNGAGGWSVPPAPSIPPGLPTTYLKTTTTDVNNTAAKTDLFGSAFTIGAGVVGATGAIKLVASGDYLNNSGANQTITLELKLGATVLWASAASDVIAASGIRRPWFTTVVIQVLNNSPWSEMAAGEFMLGAPVAVTTGLGVPADPNNAAGRTLLTPFLSVAGAVDMTAAQALTFSITHSAAASTVSMRCFYGRVEAFA